MTTYTPEPWVAERLTIKAPCQGKLKGMHHVIARIEVPLTLAEAKDTARLIAAAPETAAERDKLKLARKELRAYIEKIDVDRDKLKAINAELVTALEAAVNDVADHAREHSVNILTSCTWTLINAALDKAQPATPK